MTQTGRAHQPDAIVRADGMLSAWHVTDMQRRQLVEWASRFEPDTSVACLGERFETPDTLEEAAASHVVVVADTAATCDALVRRLAEHDASTRSIVVVDVELPALGTLESTTVCRLLATRYAFPAATGAATWHVGEVLVIAHPGLDSFLDLYVKAHRDVADLNVRVEGTLARCIDVHLLGGPLLRSQVRPVDIELQPLRVGRRGATGTITACDGTVPLGPAVRMTLATTRAVGIVIVTDRERFMTAAALRRTARMLLAGVLPASVAAMHIAGRVRRHRRRTATEG